MLYFISSLFAAAYCLLLSTFVLWRERRKTGITFAALTFAIAVWTSFPWAIQSLLSFDRLILARSIYVAACLVPPLFAAFTHSILGKRLLSKEILLSGIASLLFIGQLPSSIFIKGVQIAGGVTTPVPGPLYPFFVAFFAVVCGYAFLCIILAYRKSDASKKNRLRYVFLSFILAYLSGLLHFIAVYSNREPFPHDLLIVTFGSILAYAIVHHQLMDIRLVLRDTTLHAGTGFLLATVCLVMGLPLTTFNPYLAVIISVATMGLLMAFAYEPIRRALQPAIDRIMFANQFSYLEELGQLPNDMLEFTNLREMLKFLVSRLTEAARLERVRVLMYDPGLQSYVETIVHTAEGKTDNRDEPEGPRDLSENSALVDVLRETKQLLLAEDLSKAVKDQTSGLTELRSLGGVACFPVMKERELLGLVVLGRKRSGEAFNQQDLKILRSLRMRLENFLGQAMVITQEALNMVKDSHDMKNDVNALKGRIVWRAMKIADWKMDFEKETQALEGEKNADRMRAALHAFKSKALEWFADAERSRGIEDQAVQRLAHRLRNWAEYGRVVSEGFRGSRAMEAIEVGQAAKISVERWLPHAERKGLKLSAHTTPNLLVWGERTLVEQVIENLIDNAIKATSEGKVEVLCKADRSGILLEVKDSGCGIPAEAIATIFEKPFYQGKGRENLEQSTGVGLYLVAQYARSLGGKVWAESEVGKGSSFFVQLPKYSQEREHSGVAA